MDDFQQRRRVWFICLALALVTGLAFGRMVWDEHSFVLFDDPGYVTHNPQVRSGISWETVKWAFDPRTEVVGNYHPLTVLSHALDCQLFGAERPWAHHLMSLLIHIANSLLLFLVLRRMTGDEWPSGLVAALFAWHPLHVESVAWAAERKDLLSTLFWILAMWFYLDYARGTRWAYWGVASSLILGLLSKPMVVTLPCALLLLDYWPLRRFRLEGVSVGGLWGEARRLVVEKVPLFALVALSIPFTLFAQSAGGAISNTVTVPISVRIVNAFYSYNMYLSKTAWPTGLTVPYALETRGFTVEAMVFGALGFLMVTYLVVSWGRKFPYLPVGWFWYVGTLVPVIGLVQVGNQAMADRYTYIPLIGIFMAFAWGLQDLVRWSQFARRVVPVAVLVVLVALALATARQVGYWRDTVTLFTRSTSLNPNLFFAHYALSTGYLFEGNLDAALASVDKAIKLQPEQAMAWHCRGIILARQGAMADAAEATQRATELEPFRSAWQSDLGWMLLQLDRPAPAEEAFRAALEQDPQYFRALLGRGIIAMNRGRRSEAWALLLAAKESRASDPVASILLARMMATAPTGLRTNLAEAERLAEFACRPEAKPRPYWLDTLAAVYAAQGRFDEATQMAESALDQARAERDEELASLLETHLKKFQESQRLMEEVTAIRTDKVVPIESLLSNVQ